MISSIFKEIRFATHDIRKQLRRMGFVNAARRIYSIEGLERFVSTLIPIFEIFKFHTPHFNIWLDVLKDQRQLYRATLVFPILYNGLKEFSIINLLKGLSACCETAQFLHKYEVFSFESYHKIANQLGKSKFFSDYSIPQYCLKSPKNIFLLLGHSLELIECFIQYAKQKKETNATKRKRFLTTIISVGRISLILVKCHLSKLEWKEFMIPYHLLNLGTYSISMIKYLTVK